MIKNRQKWQGIAITLGGSLLALVIAFAICAVFLALIGHNPFTVYKQMLDYDISRDSFLDATKRAVPLMLSAAAVAVGFKMGLFNIGVEGQARMAVLLTAGIATQIHLPAILHVTFCLLLAMVVGALWASVAGILKIKRGVNEVISTIMLNYIAIGLVSWMFDTWFVVGKDTFNVTTKPLPHTAWFPQLVKGKLTGFVVVDIVVIIMFYVIVWKTKFGFHLRASGENPGAARVAGINPKRMVMTAMIFSGAIAGLVGMPILLGDSHAYGRGVAEGYGFDGIAVALLGRNHPVGIVVSGLLFGLLDHSSGILQVNSIPRSIIDIIKGVIVLTVVIVNEALKRWHNRRTQQASAAMISAIELEVAAA